VIIALPDNIQNSVKCCVAPCQ